MLALPTAVTVDDALSRSVGEWGWGQKQIYITAGLAYIPVGMQMLLFVFVGQDPVAQHLWACHGDSAACKAMFSHAHPNMCAMPRNDWHWTSRSTSLVSEWDLVCSRAWQLQLSQLLFFVGCATGTAAFHAMAEQIGFRRTLFCAAAAAAFCELLAASSPSVWWYIGFRLLVGAGSAGMAICAYTLGTDTVGPQCRSLVGLGMHCFFAIGACLLALLSAAIINWRLLTLACALVTAASCMLWGQLPESPRWLLRCGRKGEATAALAAVASRNMSKMPEQPLSDTPPAAKPLREVLQHSRLRRRALCMLLCALVATGAYYGLTGALERVRGRLHLHALFAFGWELVAVALAMVAVERLGRRLTLGASLLAGGMLSVLAVVGHGMVREVLVVAARTCCTAVMALVPQYTQELVPATAREQVATAIITLSYLGPVLVPGAALLAMTLQLHWLPLLLHGMLLLLCSIFPLLVPETLGAVQLESVADVAMSTPSQRRHGLPSSWRRLFHKPRSGLQFTLFSADTEISE